MTASPVEIRFEEGTLLVRGVPDARLLEGLPECRRDARAQAWRLPACRYRALLLRLHGSGVPYQDSARGYEPLELEERAPRDPLVHQSEGLAAWQEAGSCGVVVLPTGSGKTYLGVLAIGQVSRSALVVTPTLELVAQWADTLSAAFGGPVGVVGGGTHELAPLTVTTYASAHRKMGFLGNRFGLIIFDEVHHLPGPGYAFAARASLAPYRLGLTATPERADGQHGQLASLVGPTVYRRGIGELSGGVLAPYEVKTIEVALDPRERAEYEAARAEYLSFLDANQLRIGSRSGWQQFLWACSRTAEGRSAFNAYRKQKALARSASAKLAVLEELLHAHRDDRMIVFTADNRTVYQISRRFLVPALTHRTKVAERRALLAAFADGSLPVLVTSQVLNEGVDVPEAKVGVIVSGTGSVREHVQRLGRILRAAGGKQAILYEVLSADTSERQVSDRRREHPAYKGR